MADCSAAEKDGGSALLKLAYATEEELTAMSSKGVRLITVSVQKPLNAFDGLTEQTPYITIRVQTLYSTLLEQHNSPSNNRLASL